jgi:hypothetical protein
VAGSENPHVALHQNYLKFLRLRESAHIKTLFYQSIEPLEMHLFACLLGLFTALSNRVPDPWNVYLFKRVSVAVFLYFSFQQQLYEIRVRRNTCLCRMYMACYRRLYSSRYVGDFVDECAGYLNLMINIHINKRTKSEWIR